MFAIIDNRIPESAKKELSKHAQLLPFISNNITYDAIAGHPDIFFFQNKHQLIIAPNTPHYFIDLLEKNAIDFYFGSSNVGKKYPDTCKYNIVNNFGIAVHNFNYTDQNVMLAIQNSKKINVNQGYTRCNLILLSETHFIASDEGIYKTLLDNKMIGLLINADNIVLPNFNHGFFGGICGVIDKKLFTIGQISQLINGKNIINFIENQGYELISLGNQLFDGGGIIFISNQ